MNDKGYNAAPSAFPVDRMSTSHDANGIRIGAWSAELCGCFTDLVPNCCMAWCLPFVSVAQIAHRMNVARYSLVLITFLVLYLTALALLAFATAAVAIAAHNTSVAMSDKGVDHMDATDIQSDIVFTSGGQTILTIVTLIYGILIWQLRSKVRARFQIPGSCCGDCCSVCCCSCCTIAQMATHVKSYKPGSCDFGPPDMLPAYD